MGNGGERREISFALHTTTRLIPLCVFFDFSFFFVRSYSPSVLPLSAPYIHPPNHYSPGMKIQPTLSLMSGLFAIVFCLRLPALLFLLR